MRKGQQVSGSSIPREDQLELFLDLGPSGRTAARNLRCESSEDGDGATGRSFLEINSGRLPDSLHFAVSPPKEG